MVLGIWNAIGALQLKNGSLRCCPMDCQTQFRNVSSASFAGAVVFSAQNAWRYFYYAYAKSL
jgi:hypothetical protein